MRLRLPLTFAILLASLHSAAAKPVTSMLEMRQSGVVVQKYDRSCSAASIATLLLLKFNIRISEWDVARGLIARKEYIENPQIIRATQGFSLLDMTRAVTRLGLSLRGDSLGKVTLQDLPKFAPAIVPLEINGYNHFVVFRGISNNGRVVLADPAFGNRIMSVEQFQRFWMKVPELGHVAFVINQL